MEYLDFIRVLPQSKKQQILEQDARFAQRQSGETYDASLGKELISVQPPEPRKLGVIASPAPKHPLNSKTKAQPKNYKLTSNERIHGHLMRSGRKKKHTKHVSSQKIEFQKVINGVKEHISESFSPMHSVDSDLQHSIGVEKYASDAYLDSQFSKNYPTYQTDSKACSKKTESQVDHFILQHELQQHENSRYPVPAENPDNASADVRYQGPTEPQNVQTKIKDDQETWLLKDKQHQVGDADKAKEETLTPLQKQEQIKENSTSMTTSKQYFQSSTPCKISATADRLQRRQSYATTRLKDLIHISSVQITWWRIIIWAITHGLVGIEDIVMDMVEQAQRKRNHFAVDGFENIGANNDEMSLGSTSSNDALPLLSKFWDMLTWAAGEPSLNFRRSIIDEMDDCWSAMKEIRRRVSNAERALITSLPEEKAIAALSPTSSKRSNDTRVRTSPFVQNKNRSAGRRNIELKATSMSPSDIAGLAKEFSALHHRSEPLNSSTECFTTVDGRNSPQHYSLVDCNDIIPAKPSDQRVNHALQQSTKEIAEYPVQVKSTSNSGQIGTEQSFRSDVTCSLDGDVDKYPRNFTTVSAPAHYSLSSTSSISLRLETLRNIATCCDTIMHQWEQVVDAKPEDAPIYFSTMLHAINNIYTILEANSTHESGQS